MKISSDSIFKRVGDAIVVQVFEQAQESEVSIQGKNAMVKKFKIKSGDFEKILAILESEYLSKYKIPSSLPGPTGDPKYYSVKFSGSTGGETALQLPRAELNSAAIEMVNSMGILLSK